MPGMRRSRGTPGTPGVQPNWESSASTAVGCGVQAGVEGSARRCTAGALEATSTRPLLGAIVTGSKYFGSGGQMLALMRLASS